MEVAAVALGQVNAQMDAALSMVRNNAKAERALVSVLAQATQSAPTGGRGQNVDITV